MNQIIKCVKSSSVTSDSSISVLFPDQGESLQSFERRIKETKGEMLVIFSELEALLSKDKDARKRAMAVCKKFSTRLRIATRNTTIARAARAKAIRVIDTVGDLKKFLKDSDALGDALREFQPSIWRQELRNRLQSMGLLSLPKLRIWVLIGVSGSLLFFIVFKLLPSATVKVWPQEQTISQTANIFLAQSGAIASLPPRVRVMDLVPITVRVDKTITFDEISKEFIGENASTVFKVVNNTDEEYWLKTGTRVQNQAGMIFRLRDSISIEPQDEFIVRGDADPEDIYGEITGERGNVPADLRWELPGLTRDEQQFVYAINTEPGTGGRTAYEKVLSQKDIDIGKKKLEGELLSEAKQLINEQRDLLDAEDETSYPELLHYDELTSLEYVDFVLPDQFVGKHVKSIPIEGSIIYTMYAYDTQAVLDMLSRELMTHVGEGKRLIEGTLDLSRLIAHVIDYEDDFSWIKITVDLSGNEQHILDPLSPTGAVFAKKVRSSITGLHRDDAERIVGNYPEVKKAKVSVWPPWQRMLPGIPSSIVIEPVIE